MKPFFIALSLFVALPTAGQTTRLVSTAGTHTGDCSTFSRATIGYAITQSAPGDEIFVAEGVYTEANVLVDRDLIIRGSGSENTILQAHETPSFSVSTLAPGPAEVVSTMQSDSGEVENELTRTKREWYLSHRLAELTMDQVIAFKRSLSRTAGVQRGHSRRENRFGAEAILL